MKRTIYVSSMAVWVLGFCLLPILAAAQTYFEEPRQHTYQVTLDNGAELDVRVTESWSESRRIRCYCGNLAWNALPNGRYSILSTLNGVGINSSSDRARLRELGSWMGVAEPASIFPQWLREFAIAFAETLGETPFTIDFPDTSKVEFFRGQEDCMNLLRGLPNYAAPPPCDGMEYVLYGYQVEYAVFYDGPDRGNRGSVFFTQFKNPAWLTTSAFDYDCSHRERCRAADTPEQTYLPTNDRGQPMPFPPELTYKPVGTGRTTGHVIDLVMTNPTNDTVTFRQTPYIISPTKGDDGTLYQGFGTTGYETHVIPPGERITVPLEGLCLNVDLKPPTGAINPVDEWITPFTEPPLHPPGTTLPVGSGFQPIASDNPSIIQLTYPGTDEPFPYTFDMKGNLTEAAPLLFDLIDQIQTAYVRLETDGKIPSPYSGDPVLQERIFTQQPVWIATSLLSGDPYTKEEFQENLENQYRENYGEAIDEAPVTVQKEFEEGVNSMWSTFNLIGAEAKIQAPNPAAEEAEEEREMRCGYEQDITFHPEYCVSMKISENWSNEEERAEVIAATRHALGSSWTNADEVFGQYDISNNPTSVTAFWKALNIGGFASGYAKTYFSRSGGSSEWVSATEQLAADTSGTSDAWMSMTNDQFCTSYIVGVSLSRLRASSRAFDAMAGNEYGEDDEDQLNFLKGTKFFAKLALKYLIQSKTGQTNKSFGAYTRDAVRNQITGEISEAVMAEAEKLGLGFMDELLMAVQVESLQDLLDLGQEQLEGLLTDALGFNPFDLMGEAMGVIDEGLDALLNTFFWSNTSATANGALVISVGRQRDALHVHSQILYTREAQEATSEAMQGSGVVCREMILSDVLPGELHITTEGIASMTARAAGNGNASAYLESQHIQVFTGICICRDDPEPMVVTFVNHGWYTKERDPSMENVAEELEDSLKTFLNDKIDNGELTNTTSQSAWKDAVEGFVRDWGASHPFCE